MEFVFFRISGRPVRSAPTQVPFLESWQDPALLSSRFPGSVPWAPRGRACLRVRGSSVLQNSSGRARARASTRFWPRRPPTGSAPARRRSSPGVSPSAFGPGGSRGRPRRCRSPRSRFKRCSKTGAGAPRSARGRSPAGPDARPDSPRRTRARRPSRPESARAATFPAPRTECSSRTPEGPRRRC